MRFNASTHKLIAYYANLVAVGLIVGALGPSLGDWSRQTHSDLAGVSVVLLLRPFGYLLGALFCGHWLARHRGHPGIGVAALVCAGLMALIPLTPSLAVLAALTFSLGASESLLDVGSNTLLPWVYGRRVGPYLSGMHFAFGVGAFIAPMVVGWSLTRHGSTGPAYWLLALCLLPVALWLFLVPSPEHAVQVGEPREAPLDRRAVALCMACFFLYGGTETGFGSWIYQYAVTLKMADVSQAALLNSLFWGLLGLGRLVGIPVLARFQAKQFLTVIIPGAVLSLAFLLWFHGSVRCLWLGDIGMGLCMACIFPTLLVFAGGRLSGAGRVSSRVTSLLFVGSGAGSMFLPWVMGQLFTPLGPRAALALPLLSVAGLWGMFHVAGRARPPQAASLKRPPRN